MRLLLTLLAVVSTASAQFEGTVESENLTTEGLGGAETFRMRMHVRADRVRIETNGGGSDDVIIIYRADRSVVWLVNMKDSSYQEMPHASLTAQERPGDAGGAQFRVRPTGRTKKMLGYTCRQVLLEREEEVTEIWGATALSGITATLERVIGSSSAGGWQEELKALGLFPLLARTTIGGQVVESQTVTRVTKERPADALFNLGPRMRKEAPVMLPGGREE